MTQTTRTTLFVRFAAMAFALAVSACSGSASNPGAATATDSQQITAAAAQGDEQYYPVWWRHPEVFFTASNYAVTQSARSVSLTVKRVGAAGAALTVDYTTANGTAAAGSNYTATSGTLKWAENDSTSKTITVLI